MIKPSMYAQARGMGTRATNAPCARGHGCQTVTDKFHHTPQHMSRDEQQTHPFICGSSGSRLVQEVNHHLHGTWPQKRFPRNYNLQLINGV